MKKEIIIKLSKTFEEAAYIEQDVEYWMARDLQRLFEYSDWDNFLNVIEKAKTACLNSKSLINSHFREVTKMVTLGSGTQRKIPDIMLSRYACYLVAQNGDSRKEPIAFAQSYFALQTRKQELLEQHIEMIERLEARHKLSQTEKELSSALYQHGVDGQGFARIRSRGDQALFGGSNTIEMKHKLGVPESRSLADFLPTITIKAKDFAGEITHFNVKKENLQGENRISNEHVKNNQGVRRVLLESNIYPEELPIEEDIKKVERKIEQTSEKLMKETSSLPSNLDAKNL
jgi:DNA-damage-inducible protein D